MAKESDSFSERETVKRMDDALRRALNTTQAQQGYCRKGPKESQAQSEKGLGAETPVMKWV